MKYLFGTFVLLKGENVMTCVERQVLDRTDIKEINGFYNDFTGCWQKLQDIRFSKVINDLF